MKEKVKTKKKCRPFGKTAAVSLTMLVLIALALWLGRGRIIAYTNDDIDRGTVVGYTPDGKAIYASKENPEGLIGYAENGDPIYANDVLLSYYDSDGKPVYEEIKEDTPEEKTAKQQAEIEKLNARSEADQKQLQSLQEELAKAKGQNATNVISANAAAEKDAKIQELMKELSDTSSRIQKISSEVPTTQNNEELQKKQQELVDLSSQLTALERKLASLSGDYNKNKQALADAKSTNSSLNDKISSLNGKLDSANSELSKIKGSLSSTESDNANLKGQISSKESEIEALKSKVAGLNADKDKLAQDLEKAKSDTTKADEIKVKLEEVTAKLESAQKDLERSKTELSEYQANVKYTVTFDPQSGDSNSEISYALKEGETCTVPSVTRRGYTFDGWFIGKSGGTAVYQGGETYTMGKTYTTYYAHWSVETYSISYDYGVTAADSSITDKGTEIGSYTVETDTFSLNSPVRTGYDFLGWQDSDGNRLKKMVKGRYAEDLSLTALWGKTAFNVKYVLSNGQSSGANRSSFIDTDLPVSLLDATQDSHYFRGWYEDATFTGAKVESLTEKKDYTLYPKFDIVISIPEGKSLIYNKEEQTGVADGVGYIVSDNTATEKGSYTAKVTPESGYCWSDGSTETRTVDWSIGQKNIGGRDISVSLSETEYTYDGKEHKPSVIVKDGDTELVKNTDYTVSYPSDVTNASDNITITINAVADGNYTGTNSASYKINKAQGTVSVKDSDGNTLIDKIRNFFFPDIKTVTVFGDFDGDVDVSSNNKTVTINKDKGTGTGYNSSFDINLTPHGTGDDVSVITFTPEDGNNFTAANEITLTVSVSKGKIAYTVDTSSSTFTYDGAAHDTYATITSTVKDSELKDKTPTILYSTTNEDGSWSADKPKFTDVPDVAHEAASGTVKVFWKIKDENYEDETGDFDVQINKAPSSWLSPPSGGTSFTAGTPVGGEAWYRKDNGAWQKASDFAAPSTACTVYYKIFGDKNHLDLDEGKCVSINPETTHSKNLSEWSSDGHQWYLSGYESRGYITDVSYGYGGSVYYYNDGVYFSDGSGAYYISGSTTISATY